MRRFFASTVILICFLTYVLAAPEAEARRRSHSSKSSSSHTRSSSRHSRSHSQVSTRHRGRHHTRSSHRHGRGRHHAAPKAAAKPKYAYPLELFQMNPPEFDQTPLPAEASQKLRRDFERGLADRSHPNDLVRGGVVLYHPLRGGIFKRREQVKYIILHSTETGPPVSATSVIDAWSSLGRRHAGAQYVVERDGQIYQSCEPDMATVHVNIFKTLPGINNDNSIGIEMNHTGRQNYPPAQRESVRKLVSYLQDRYRVLNENIITHRYAQQGDHTDPVSFDFDQFLAWKDEFHNKALAMKRDLYPQPQQPAQPAATQVEVVTTEKQPTPETQPAATSDQPATTPETQPATAPETQPATAPETPTTPNTALTPKDATQPSPPSADTGKETGAPLPGPPVLRKELELGPSDAASVEAEPQPPLVP